MAEKPRIKRIDRVGNTAEIPYSRTIRDMKTQRWVANRFFRLMGRSAFFWDNPEESVGAGIARGSNYFDLKDTASRIKCLEEYAKENIRTATRLESLGKREEDAGHHETAGDYYCPCRKQQSADTICICKPVRNGLVDIMGHCFCNLIISREP